MNEELTLQEFKTSKKVVEVAFEKYRLFKYLLNVPNLDTITEPEKEEYSKRQLFCEFIEGIVSKLPSKERFLIEERYMSLEADYISDYEIYSDKMKIAENTYSKIRKRAFSKLYLKLKKIND
ncbi:hypothetical protein J2S74_005399 [Evansella vedderi]|uniref:Uncharacterized protein n=1 Tax=Evansella vedderi TaxID=38282 RepID=A0ABU0A4P3_9BACI|nr:hypothetical protein [Evansella vedderi]MDQ0257936.1 hypothetical protein [Evansella vedderi]